MPATPDVARDVSVVGLGHRKVHGDTSIFWDNSRRALPDNLPYCLLQYTIEGAGLFVDAGLRHEIDAGKAFLTVIPSPTQYALEPGSRWHWAWLGFRGDLARRIVEAINARAGRVLDLPLSSPAVQRLFDLIEAATPGPIESPWELSARTYEILMDLCRLTLEAPLPQKGVQRAKALIARRLDDQDLDLQALADEAGLSRYHFLRRFKQETGQTPASYLRDKRLLRAMDLLTLSDLSVKRIALMCGYRRSAHFCAAFRRRFGRTPGSIRPG